MIFWTSFVLFAFAIDVPPSLAVQSCNNVIRATSPESGFEVSKNGVVIQPSTALMWMRCALGQQWNDQTCAGNATKMSWSDALKSADTYVFAGYDDWRLPNKNELESIIEESCALPAINAKIFPSSLSDFFWTGSPYVGLSTGAWSVDFAFGVVTATDKNGTIYVRLVRDKN